MILTTMQPVSNFTGFFIKKFCHLHNKNSYRKTYGDNKYSTWE